MTRPLGRSGRGRGRENRREKNYFNDNKSKNDGKNDEISHLLFNVGTAKQASNFVAIKKYCINTFKMKYKQGIYLATALEDGKDFDFQMDQPAPLLLVPEKGTEEEVLIAQGRNESSRMDYRRKMDKYNEKLEVFEENKYKAYGFLWEKCSAQMKQNIEAKQDYQTKIKNNPFELLKTIEALSYNYQDTKYEVAIIFDAIKTFINLRQNEEEHLTSYLERFNAAADNVITQLGNEITMSKYIKTMDGYNQENEKTYTKQAFEELKAFAFLSNSDNTKYGTIIKALAQQQSLKNSQYPKTVTAASQVLMEHTWDQKYHDEKKRKNEQQTNSDNTNQNNNSNRLPEELELSFAQLQNACYCCGKKGHSANKCYKKDTIPKEEWYINQLQKQETERIIKQHQEQQQQHVQINTDNLMTTSSSRSSSNNTNETINEWSGAHITSNDTNLELLKDTILLDNGSTKSIFSNPRMVTNIRPADNPIVLQTNGGDIAMNEMATVPGFGDVWYNTNCIGNIFSFAELKQRHPITYNSNEEDAFLIHLPNKIIKFTKLPNGLYQYKPNDYVLQPINECITNQANIAGVDNKPTERNSDLLAGVNIMNDGNKNDTRKKRSNNRSKKYKNKKHYKQYNSNNELNDTNPINEPNNSNNTSMSNESNHVNQIKDTNTKNELNEIINEGNETNEADNMNDANDNNKNELIEIKAINLNTHDSNQITTNEMNINEMNENKSNKQNEMSSNTAYNNLAMNMKNNMKILFNKMKEVQSNYMNEEWILYN